MKLHIRENIHITEQYKSLIESIFTELLTDTDIVDELTSYIPDFDPNVEYEDYADNEIVQEIKQDIYNSIIRLESDILALPEVRRVEFTKSSHMGLSNYIHIRFNKPNNAPDSWRHDYKHLYDMNLKVSDHFHFNRPSVTHTLSLLHKDLAKINEDILDTVNNQIGLIKQAEALIHNYT